MIVVSDTSPPSPLCYLALIGCPEVLSKLYGEILTTQTVAAELRHSDAPPTVREWISSPPVWLKIEADPVESDSSLASLHPGERSAIRLAEKYGSAVVLLDDSAARAIAAQRNLVIAAGLRALFVVRTCPLIKETRRCDTGRCFSRQPNSRVDAAFAR